MYKLICNCCEEVLRELRNNNKENIDLSKEISNRHQNFYNEFIDDRCKKRDESHKYNFSYRLQKITIRELQEIRNKEYLLSANL